MTAYQKFPMSPLAKVLTRDQNGNALDDAAKQLKDRVAKMDSLLERYSSQLANVPENLKKELEDHARSVQKAAADIDEIKQKLVDGVRSGGDDPDTTAAILIRNTEAVGMAARMATSSKKGSIVFDGLKARNVVSLAGLPEHAIFAKNDLNRQPVQPLSVIELINWIPTLDKVVYYLRESSFDIMAAIAPENTDKAESDIEFGELELNCGSIAHWIRATKQLLADMPALANYIETRMAWGVRYKLEYYVVNGHIPSGSAQKIFSGLLEVGNHETVTPATGDTAIDVLSKAKYKAADSFVMPTTLLLNPEDWGKIERIKGTDGHYIFGSPGAAVQPVLWGVPVVFAASMPKGKYWIGNLSVAFDGYMREDVSITVSTEDGNNITKNLVTILAEMRASGAVVLPDSCVAGDLPTAETY